MSTESQESELLPEQRQVLQVVYEHWSATIKWPLYGYLDALLDHDHDIELAAVLPTVPEELIVYPRIPSASDDSEVRLTIAGIAQCENSRGDVQLFVDALKWCVRRQKEHRPASNKPEQLKLTSADAAADWTAAGEEVSDVILGKAFSLLATENIPWGSGLGADAPHDWNVNINRDIRRFRPVDTLDDYLRIKVEQHRIQPAHLPMVVPRVRLRSAAIDLFRAGVVEPEHQLALEDLHPAIRDAASPLFAVQRYRQGVLDAGLALRDIVRARSGLSEETDSTLMGKAFGAKPPAIVVADLTVPTGRNVQRGITYLAEAIVAGVRNRLTHESAEIEVPEAMEMLAMMSHVLRLVDQPWTPSSTSTDC